MEVFDRTVPALIGYTRFVTGVTATDAKTRRAVEHVARVLHVLKVLSKLCTYLNGCSFYSAERDEGLNDDALFAAPAKNPTEKQYWNAYLRNLLQGAKTPKALHKAAVRIQFLAIKPMAACIEKYVKKVFPNNTAAKAVMEHLHALTGPALNSSLDKLDASEFPHGLDHVTHDHVEAETEKDEDIFDATLMHLLYFAGPVDGLVKEARTQLCSTLDSIPDTRISNEIDNAVRRASHNVRHLLLQCQHTRGREDSICDDTMFMHVAYVLYRLREFIEYESLDI